MGPYRGPLDQLSGINIDCEDSWWWANWFEGSTPLSRQEDLCFCWNERVTSFPVLCQHTRVTFRTWFCVLKFPTSGVHAVFCVYDSRVSIYRSVIGKSREDLDLKDVGFCGSVLWLTSHRQITYRCSFIYIVNRRQINNPLSSQNCWVQ